MLSLKEVIKEGLILSSNMEMILKHLSPEARQRFLQLLISPEIEPDNVKRFEAIGRIDFILNYGHPGIPMKTQIQLTTSL